MSPVTYQCHAPRHTRDTLLGVKGAPAGSQAVIDPPIPSHRRSFAAAALAVKIACDDQKYTVGVYHSLTENLTLLAEFTDTKAEAHDGVENDSSNFNIGAYLSF